MGNTVFSCCCYRRNTQKPPMMGEDMKRAFGFSIYEDSSDEEIKSFKKKDKDDDEEN